MSYKKLATLLGALSERTNSGKIEWEESARTDSYETSFPHYSVVLNHDVKDGREDYKLYVVDDTGDVVESATDEDFHEFIGDPFSLMKEMYETARRQAKGVDQALDEILGELNDDDNIPF